MNSSEERELIETLQWRKQKLRESSKEFQKVSARLSSKGSFWEMRRMFSDGQRLCLVSCTGGLRREHFL